MLGEKIYTYYVEEVDCKVTSEEPDHCEQMLGPVVQDLCRVYKEGVFQPMTDDML